jgi:chromosome segregation ATPase
MARKSDTRDKVFEAADAILQEGGKPTQQNVRDRIGVGSISTINSALNDWWSTLAQRMQPSADANVPEPVLRVAEQVWNQALAYSEQKYQTFATQLSEDRESKLSEKESQIRELQARNDYLLDENRSLSQRLFEKPAQEAGKEHEIKSLEDQLFETTRAKEALLREVKQLTRELEYRDQAKASLQAEDLKAVISEKDNLNNELDAENKRLYKELRQLTQSNQSLREAMYNLEKDAMKQQHRLELVIAQQDARYQDAAKALEDCKNQLAHQRR